MPTFIHTYTYACHIIHVDLHSPGTRRPICDWVISSQSHAGRTCTACSLYESNLYALPHIYFSVLSHVIVSDGYVQSCWTNSFWQSCTTAYNDRPTAVVAI